MFFKYSLFKMRNKQQCRTFTTLPLFWTLILKREAVCNKDPISLRFKNKGTLLLETYSQTKTVF